jgi:hypothetical protein
VLYGGVDKAPGSSGLEPPGGAALAPGRTRSGLKKTAGQFRFDGAGVG